MKSLTRKLTVEMADIVKKAHDYAATNRHQYFDYLHILRTSILDTDSQIGEILRSLDADVSTIQGEVEGELKEKYTLVNIPGQKPAEDESQDLIRVYRSADAVQRDFGDQFLASDIFFLGFLKNADFPEDHGKFQKYLDKQGINYKTALAVVKQTRKGKRIKSADDTTIRMLDRYGHSMVDIYRTGYHDPVLGRNAETRQVENILIRLKKNNVLLVGDAGVGKTAIVEGLAQLMAAGKVPDLLKDRDLYQIDLASLLSGSATRGEFEKRLTALIDEVEASNGKIMLFIDEIHQILGAGNNGNGGMDAGNILKPALARGRLHLIGATTLEEYKTHLEKDAAFTRRFDKLEVAEPSHEVTLSILRGMQKHLETVHHVQIEDDALKAVVSYADRYINNRQFPAKAIDLLDDAVAGVHLDIDAEPQEMAVLGGKIDREKMALNAYENDVKPHDQLEIDNLKNKLQTNQNEYNHKKDLWLTSKKSILNHKPIDDNLTVEKVQKQLLDSANQAKDYYSQQKEKEAYHLLSDIIPHLKQELIDLKAGHKINLAYHLPTGEQLTNVVTPNAVARSVSRITGIKLTTITANEKEKLLKLPSILHKRVIGQNQAIDAVVGAVKRGRLNIKSATKPIGSFLFLGPTGTGKTELAKTLAENLFGDERNMLRLDMSEYQDKNQASRLIGAAPGYVGYEEGGVLTEFVKNHPQSEILFDEVEKAHPSVFDMLLQVLDDARLTDSKGTTVDFSNTIIILTSNVGATFTFENLDAAGHVTEDGKHIIFQKTKQFFRPEFLNRLDGRVIFDPLTYDNMVMISKKMVKNEFEIFKKNYPKIKFEILNANQQMPDEVYRFIADSGRAASGLFEMGARPLQRFIQDRLVNKLIDFMISDLIQDGDHVGISIGNARVSQAEQLRLSQRSGEVPHEFVFFVTKPNGKKQTLYESSKII